MKHYTPIYGHLQFFLFGAAERCVNLVRMISGYCKRMRAQAQEVAGSQLPDPISLISTKYKICRPCFRIYNYNKKAGRLNDELAMNYGP